MRLTAILPRRSTTRKFISSVRLGAGHAHRCFFPRRSFQPPGWTGGFPFEKPAAYRRNPAAGQRKYLLQSWCGCPPLSAERWQWSAKAMSSLWRAGNGPERGYYTVRGDDKGVDGHHAQGGHTVDQHITIFVCVDICA